MQQFLENNWLSIVSILIGILVAYIFYRLQKKDTTSATVERKKHATTELLDVVESYIINKQKLSEHVIDNLILASERDHAVGLRESCTAVSLLQDVALRLQRSRHLDIPQKSEYGEHIEELIHQIQLPGATRAGTVPLSADVRERAAALEELVPVERKEEARAKLAELLAVNNKQREVSARRESESSARLAAAMAGLAAALAVTFLGTKLFGQVVGTSLADALSKVIPFMVGMVGAAVVLSLATTALRIRRRAREIDERVDREAERS